MNNKIFGLLMGLSGMAVWTALFFVIDSAREWHAPGYAYYLAAMIGAVHFSSEGIKRER